MKLSLRSASAGATREIGRQLGRMCLAGDWIGLTGELGAGKTCLVQGLALGLEVAEGYQVTSPTFIIHQTYPGRIPLHHLDLYRLSTLAELAEIGYDDLLDGEGAVVVEWCDRIPGASPGRGLLVTITLEDETTRRIEMEGLDERGREMLGGLGTPGSAS